MQRYGRSGTSGLGVETFEHLISLRGDAGMNTSKLETSTASSTQSLGKRGTGAWLIPFQCSTFLKQNLQRLYGSCSFKHACFKRLHGSCSFEYACFKIQLVLSQSAYVCSLMQRLAEGLEFGKTDATRLSYGAAPVWQAMAWRSSKLQLHRSWPT